VGQAASRRAWGACCLSAVGVRAAKMRRSQCVSMRRNEMGTAAVGLRRRPGAHPALGLDVGALLNQARGHNRLILCQRTVQWSQPL
jgi:hypothetical protein